MEKPDKSTPELEIVTSSPPDKAPRIPDFSAGGPRRKRVGHPIHGEWEGDYHNLLQSIYDGVLITGENGRIGEFNVRATDLLGMDAASLENASVLDVVAGASGSLLDDILANLEDRLYTLLECSCRRGDGTTFPAEIAVNRVILEKKSHLCFFIRNITVRKRAQAELEKAVLHLEAHDRARMQFVSNVSHELRTPLTSMIYAVTNMLRGVAGELTPRVRRYLEILSGDCKRLLGTVNDILDLNKIESNTLQLVYSKAPFGHLIQNSAASLRVQADQKSIALEIDRGPTPLFVECDVHKMERVILNVVGNAVKFTPERGRVDISLCMDPVREGHALLTVCDDGIGIPPKAIPKVTGRYFTVGEQPSGSGLGLAISKEIVDLHHGHLEITSPPPGRTKGTAVCISLPMAAAPRVLVADDDDAVRMLLAEQLGREGYDILCATSGREVLEKVAAESPDVLVLDLSLPEMMGAEVILKLKSNKDTLRLPIIVVTGMHVGQPTAELLRRFGIPTLMKPWDEKILAERIAGSFLGTSLFTG
jgi:PAS domain S-box-containing protein